MTTEVVTYNAQGEILAKFLFTTLAQALDHVGNYDLTTGNIRSGWIAKITIERETE